MLDPADLRGALILGAAFLGLLALAEAWRRLGNPKPEWTRKLVHLAGGAICLLFPFLIRSPLVVLVMALGLTGIFTFAARAGLLKSLHGVKRPSRGAEYYPLAVWLVFFLASDRPWLYLAALLVLAVGDAFAALVGSRYGVVRYEVEDEHKSLEGSLVFLVIAFLAIHLPTLLLTDLPRATCVLAALLVAVLVTGFEAISLQGADNLFVPLAVVWILPKITAKPLPEIVSQNVSLSLIVLGVFLLVSRFPLFNVGGTIVFILYAYGNWSLGSWHWALPVFAGFGCYVALAIGSASRRRLPRLKVRIVAYALVVPFLSLVIANVTGRYDRLFGPYMAASAAVLAFSLAGPLSGLGPLSGARRAGRVLAATLIAGAMTILPVWLLQSGTPLSAPITTAVVLLATTLGFALLEGASGPDVVPRWTARRLLLSAGASVAVWVLQVAGVSASWHLP